MKTRSQLSVLFVAACAVAVFTATGITAQTSTPVKASAATSERVHLRAQAATIKNSVDTIQQCYKYNPMTSNDKCNKSSTWLVEWGHAKSNTNPCGVAVYASYERERLDCESVKEFPLSPADDLTILAYSSDVKKTLSDIVVADNECGEVWLRFVDKNGCNWQILCIDGICFILP